MSRSSLPYTAYQTSTVVYTVNTEQRVPTIDRRASNADRRATTSATTTTTAAHAHTPRMFNNDSSSTQFPPTQASQRRDVRETGAQFSNYDLTTMPPAFRDEDFRSTSQQPNGTQRPSLPRTSDSASTRTTPPQSSQRTQVPTGSQTRAVSARSRSPIIRSTSAPRQVQQGNYQSTSSETRRR